jgi:hypothetical protein
MAECCYDEFMLRVIYADCYKYALSAECYAKCRYAERRGAGLETQAYYGIHTLRICNVYSTGPSAKVRWPVMAKV